MTTSANSLAYQPAVQLAQAIASRELRSEELVELLLERITRHDEKLHAFVEVYA
ncbi:MAG: amidase, partial [Proteobacteria bacterium]|nr:amidase [Pseudomonadota bacterium]